MMLTEFVKVLKEKRPYSSTGLNMQNLVVERLNWEAMPNMGEEALDGYSEQDRPMFTRIRDCLVRYNAYEIFGLYLVHKHFDIADDEEMVEHVDFDLSIVEIYPVKRDHLDMSAMVPTNWFFVEGRGSRPVVHIAQWGHLNDLQGTETKPLSDKYEACFQEIYQILKSGNSLSRFGIFLIRNQFRFEQEENQLECTDHDGRRLKLTTQLRSSDAENAIPTNWLFTPTAEVAVNCCECARNSGGHLGYHRGKAS
jgi:hypothetical protein